MLVKRTHYRYGYHSCIVIIYRYEYHNCIVIIWQSKTCFIHLNKNVLLIRRDILYSLVFAACCIFLYGFFLLWSETWNITQTIYRIPINRFITAFSNTRHSAVLTDISNHVRYLLNNFLSLPIKLEQTPCGILMKLNCLLDLEWNYTKLGKQMIRSNYDILFFFNNQNVRAMRILDWQ